MENSSTTLVYLCGLVFCVLVVSSISHGDVFVQYGMGQGEVDRLVNLNVADHCGICVSHSTHKGKDKYFLYNKIILQCNLEFPISGVVSTLASHHGNPGLIL